jgi:FAD/FMN-containing dehydrogenase
MFSPAGHDEVAGVVRVARDRRMPLIPFGVMSVAAPAAISIARQTSKHAPYMRQLVRPVDAARIEQAVIAVDRWASDRS